MLQEEIMLFVNEIADIVHSIVDHFSGAPNKNIGEAFLLVWKYSSEDEEINKETKVISLKHSNKINQIADMATVSFIK